MQAQVQCPSCGTSNPTGKVFCISCGNALMGSPATKPGVGTVALNPPPPPPYTPSPPSTSFSGPGSTPFSASPQAAQPEQQSAWLQPTQAYPAPSAPTPAPYTPPPAYQPPPAQPQYTQPVPYQPSAPYPAPPPAYQAPQQTGQMPIAQYDPYGMPIASAPPQYGQYPQYGQPNQYVNVQITGAYPQGAYPAAQPATPAVVRSGIAFWSLWLLATVVAWAIAFPAGLALWDAIDEPVVKNVLQGILSNSSNTVLNLIVFGSVILAIVGVVIGLVNGIAQWLVFLWKGKRAGSWASASLIGWVIGLIAAWSVVVLIFNNQPAVFEDFLSFFSSPLLSSSIGSVLYVASVFGAVAGLILGLIQWIALHKHSGKAGLWVIASPVAWAIAACALVLVMNIIAQSSFGVQLNPILSNALYGAAIGVVGGATTGAALAAIV